MIALCNDVDQRSPHKGRRSRFGPAKGAGFCWAGPSSSVSETTAMAHSSDIVTWRHCGQPARTGWGSGSCCGLGCDFRTEADGVAALIFWRLGFRTEDDGVAAVTFRAFGAGLAGLGVDGVTAVTVRAFGAGRAGLGAGTLACDGRPVRASAGMKTWRLFEQHQHVVPAFVTFWSHKPGRRPPRLCRRHLQSRALFLQAQ